MTDEWTSEIDASFARAVLDRLDAIAALGAERRPRAGERGGPPEPSWTSALPAEKRLLEEVDRLLRLEGSAARITEEAKRVAATAYDPRRAWSVALLLASAPGEDAASISAGTLRTPTHAPRAAVKEALGLGRSTELAPALLRLTDDSPPLVCADALDVLRFRREASFAPCAVLLGHWHRDVAASAARCLATVPERAAAAALLRDVLAHDPDEALAVAAAESLLILGDPAGLAFVRSELEAESTSPQLSEETRVAFVRLLALAGDAGDLELFFRSLEPSPGDAAAVGWFGHADLVDWLLGSLETANEARRTGPRGRASSPSLHDPAAFELAAADALVRIAGAPDGVPAGTVEASAWRAFWGRARARFTPAQKHRFGRPYTPDAIIDELAGDAPTGVRADAALELAIVTGGASRVEPHDWIARQRRAIAIAAELVATTAAWTPGTFPGRRLGR